MSAEFDIIIHLQVACSSDVKPCVAFYRYFMTGRLRPCLLFAVGIIDELIAATKVFANK